MTLDQSFRYRHILKAKGPVDGDGDGWVYDGTPKKRPATPAEMEAGRKLRQAAKRAPAKVAAAKGKRAAPKNDYDKRYDKFDRAINQAIRAGDAKEIKRVRDLIRQDFVLKANDRKDLEAVLDARRDGKPDPAPVPGGNREKRGVKGGGAVPAKKAPAKRAAPKAETPPKKGGPVTRAHEAMREAGLDIPAKKAPAKKAPAKKALPKKQGVIREAAKQPAEVDPPAPKNPSRSPGSKAKSNLRRMGEQMGLRERNLSSLAGAKKPAAKKTPANRGGTDFGDLEDGPETQAYEAIEQAKNDQDLNAIVDRIDRALNAGQVNMERRNGVLAEVRRKRLELRQSKKPEGTNTRAGRTLRAGPSKGQKTKAWMGLVQRDIRNAKTGQDLVNIGRQIVSLERQGRISADEARVLKAKVKRRETELLQRHGSAMARMQRVREQVRAPKTPPKDRDKAEAALAQLKRQFDAAQDADALESVKRGIGSPTKALMRQHPDLLERLNDAFGDRKKALKAAARASTGHQARRDHFDRRLAEAAKMRKRQDRELELGNILDELNDDTELSQETRMEIIDRVEAINRDGKDPGWISDAGAEAARGDVSSVLKPAAGSIKPKAPPGQARARAKDRLEGMSPEAREAWGRIDRAKDMDTLNDIVRDFNDGRINVGLDEVDEVFDHLENKQRQLVPIQERRGDIVNLPARESGVPNYDGDVEDSPAAQHLKAGGDIEDIPDPAGLVDYLRAHPERYHVQRIAGGQGGAFTVVDQESGKNYFFKETDNDGGAWMFGDGINEYLAGNIGNAAFEGIFPGVDFAGRPEGNVNAHIRMDHIEEVGKRFPGFRRAKTNGRTASGDKIKDPRNPLAIHIFDYLINQTDRHGENYGVVETDSGQIIVPLDNGAAFHGYDAYVAQPMAMAFFGIDPRVGEALADSPEDVGYEDWARIPKARPMRGLAKNAYRAKGWGRDKMAADAEAIIEQFRKVDLDAIIADLLERFPEMSGYERDHLEGARLIWKNRLNQISANDVVRMLNG